MADNVTIPATGSGTATPVVATDDVGGVHFQQMKLTDGTLNSSTPVAVDIGVKANALRTAPASDITDATYIGDIKFGESLPAGTAEIGKLAANSGVDIGDVDVTSIAAGDNNIGNVDIVTLPNVTLAAGTNTNEVVGDVAHDIGIAGNPLTIGGVASAAAPADVSADQDAVRAWYLRNGAAASVLTAAGALIGGDAANGLDIDVTRLPALVAGSANIGDVDVLTVPAPLSTTGSGTEATALRVTVATDSTGVLSVDDNGSSLTIDGSISIIGTALTVGAVDETGSSAVDALAIGGGTPHDSVNSGNPVLNGAEAIAHGTNPTAVAAADRTKLYANRAGVPFVIGGHPNVVTIKHTTITTAVTDAAIVTVAGGLKIVVTRVSVTLDNASTVFPTLLIGFGTATTPTTTGVLVAHGGVPAGGGITVGDGSGILGIGADDADLRVTTTGNATGNGLQIVVSYYTIES
jgi:hypothetical protein